MNCIWEVVGTWNRQGGELKKTEKRGSMLVADLLKWKIVKSLQDVVSDLGRGED